MVLGALAQECGPTLGTPFFDATLAPFMRNPLAALGADASPARSHLVLSIHGHLYSQVNTAGE